jgi:hypothetical protein
MAPRVPYAKKRYPRTKNKMAQRACKKLRLPQTPSSTTEIFIGLLFLDIIMLKL